MSESHELPSDLPPDLPATRIAGNGLLGELMVPSALAARPTNIDTSTPDGKALAVNASGIADHYLPESGEAQFAIHRYLVTPGEDIDEETGELRLYPKTVLIAPDGSTFGSASLVILRRLASIVSNYGPGPWEPPIPVLLFERKAKRTGRRYHDLKILPTEVRDAEVGSVKPRGRSKGSD